VDAHDAGVCLNRGPSFNQCILLLITGGAESNFASSNDQSSRDSQSSNRGRGVWNTKGPPSVSRQAERLLPTRRGAWLVSVDDGRSIVRAAHLNSIVFLIQRVLGIAAGTTRTRVPAMCFGPVFPSSRFLESSWSQEGRHRFLFQGGAQSLLQKHLRSTRIWYVGLENYDYFDHNPSYRLWRCS
jgi:hypothetical protein